MKPLDEVIRVVMIPYYDDKPRRHKWYKYLAKIGTGCGTIIWADKSELNEGDTCYFADPFDIDLGDRSKYVKYPSDNAIRRGTVTHINGEGRVFISLG